MKLNAKARAALALICTAVGLAGCATNTKVARLDGQPLMPDNMVAKIGLHTAESFPGKPLNTHWGVDIRAIDGVAVPPQTVYVQLPPGEHTIEYDCWFKFSLNDLGGASSKNKKAKYILEAGASYYPYAKGKMATSKSSGGFYESTGVCEIEKLSQDDPFFHH